ncbi:hypothetical protein [Enterocloster lavalensis]|uniref:hypothetical protein n=1 Tax=Enterocloster lavalensis TaxID=460384 RepID=UPI0023F381D7|nr:hypothetical protein [Enterocloster lavalensis]
MNWNFGYRSRWCGIDPWLLGMTLKQNNSNQKEYFDGELLKKACELAVKEVERSIRIYFDDKSELNLSLETGKVMPFKEI